MGYYDFTAAHRSTDAEALGNGERKTPRTYAAAGTEHPHQQHFFHLAVRVVGGSALEETTMTVAELIEELKRLPPHYPIVSSDWESIVSIDSRQLSHGIGPIAIIRTNGESLLKRDY